jgi:DNA repair protein RecO (recombination protein O)
MLHKTRGIVFHTTDYSETSIVAKIYTEMFGVQSYLVNSVRKKNAKTRSNIFQPLSLVEMVVYHKERGGLQRISEIRNTPQYRSIPFDVSKSSILLFLHEVLYRAIREEDSNPTLFEYLFSALQLLDVQSESNPNFHLLFLLRLTRLLGFYPHGEYSQDSPIFNLQEGVYQSQFPPHPFYLTTPLSSRFGELVNACGDLTAHCSLSSEEKRILIDRLLEYYRLHIDGFGEVRSHRVLEQVWA